MGLISAIVPVLIRSVATRGRIVAMAALGLVGVLIGVVIRQSDPPDRFEPMQLIERFGFSLLVPIVALVVASATLGNLVENRTLVYFWLRPIASWQVVLSAFVAGLVIVTPLVVVPLSALAAVLGDSNDIAATAVAAVVGAVGYVAVFTGLGLVTQRALAFGLAYILVWEGFIAGLSRGAGRFALTSYTRSVLSQLADVTGLIDDPYSVATAVIVMICVALGACAITSWRFSTQDVD